MGCAASTDAEPPYRPPAAAPPRQYGAPPGVGAGGTPAGYPTKEQPPTWAAQPGQQPGYAPQPQYAPQQPGYAPQQQYAQQAAAYAPQPQHMMAPQQQVVVVGGQAPMHQQQQQRIYVDQHGNRLPVDQFGRPIVPGHPMYGGGGGFVQGGYVNNGGVSSGMAVAGGVVGGVVLGEMLFGGHDGGFDGGGDW